MTAEEVCMYGFRYDDPLPVRHVDGFPHYIRDAGVGMSLMIVFAEIMYWRKKDSDYAIMAKRWTKTLGILLGVAIPSGTIVGVMLALLWPGFMEIVGHVIALPFQIEIWAFSSRLYLWPSTSTRRIA